MPAGLELWWLGQSGFRLRDLAKGTLVFVDPFLSPHEERAWPAPLTPHELAQADLILCSHEHLDHFDRPALAAAAEAGGRFTLIVPRPLVDEARALGIPDHRILGAQPGQPLTAAGVQVHPVPACHGVHMADAYSFGKEMSNGLVRFLGYVIDLGGVRVYHAGDTIPYEGQVERLRRLQPHLALLPINGRDFFRETERDLVGNMNPREAAHLASDIGAEVLVPMHWEMFNHNRGFPRDVVAYVEAYLPHLTVLVFGRGSRLTYLPSSV